MDKSINEFHSQDLKADLELAGWSALSLLSTRPVRLQCNYYPYADLKATARMKEGTIHVRVSDEFAAATQEVLTGLLLHLLSRLLRRPLNNTGSELVRAYKEFSRRKSTAELGNSVHRLRNRRNSLQPSGFSLDLREVRDKVLSDYSAVFAGVAAPEITWSAGNGSRRVLAYHDRALSRIVVSSRLDSPVVPEIVVERIVYHELLHAKHGVKYECGPSMQARVHTREFFTDERNFRNIEQADGWLKRNRI